MDLRFLAPGTDARRRLKIGAVAAAVLLSPLGTSQAEDKKPPCTEDAMIVFDASGSMSGNQTLGIPNTRARIDEIRSALAHVLPSATRFRRVGLVTYGPGPYNQCNVKVDLTPTSNAASQIMDVVDALVPAGKTALTEAVEEAAKVLNYTKKPGVLVLVTDGEETCGRNPCELATRLQANADQLTVHVIGFRYSNYSWTGSSVLDIRCLADINNGLYIKADSEAELIEALEKTLDCPMVSQAPLNWKALP